MRVPSGLASAFDASFESLIGQFALERSMLPDIESLRSNRFISRSIVPHVRKLSSLFNREDLRAGQASALEPYWKESSNPAHLRAAYFLYFMPCNVFRIASVWTELARLGFRWGAGEVFRGIELGAGPAPGACAAAIAERFAPVGLPREGSWALIEQDKAMLELGREWAGTFLEANGAPDWDLRAFHRRLKLKEGEILPRSAPRFNAWVMSYFLNELSEPVADIARELVRAWERHLEEEGVVLLVEPALKLQSRKLLELRREILLEAERRGIDWLRILLPCLGHQACGALAQPEDWCHEEVTWWRPPYLRLIDDLAELDRKTLPFSYLVIAKSRRSRAELLPALGAASAHRLVSPAHREGRELEFFVCGQDGKRRARYRPADKRDPGSELDRGDLLLDAELRGDARSSRVEKIDSIR